MELFHGTEPNTGCRLYRDVARIIMFLSRVSAILVAVKCSEVVAQPRSREVKTSGDDNLLNFEFEFCIEMDIESIKLRFVTSIETVQPLTGLQKLTKMSDIISMLDHVEGNRYNGITIATLWCTWVNTQSSSLSILIHDECMISKIILLLYAK